MRFEFSYHTERFGAVRIYERQRVIELGADDAGDSRGGSAVGRQAVREVERELVIVVPCKNEARQVLEGVLSGIPHHCLIVVVSNSDRWPVDRYEAEKSVVQQFCRLSGRPAITVHQRDPGLASAFKAAGMPELLDSDGLVHHGKGEGMLIGMALAAMTRRKFIGYVDADNYIPGAVFEYCKVFAAGLALADGPYAMVRVNWSSKPKVTDGKLIFRPRGRTSEVTNSLLNRLLTEHSGFGTEVIVTGNAGEHAMSLALGMRMRTAGGYAVEPFQLLELFEQFGGCTPATATADMVDVRQIQTRNPHLHDDRGGEHVSQMLDQSLQAIYHSAVCPPPLREDIQALHGGAVPAPARIYPPINSLMLDVLHDGLTAGSETLYLVPAPDGDADGGVAWYRPSDPVNLLGPAERPSQRR
jgi:mannosyl-3-phosphoglycerate synthase